MELKLIKNGKETPLIEMWNRIIHTIGGSLGVTIPHKVVKQSGLKAGDSVYVYTNGKGQIVIDLKPRG